MNKLEPKVKQKKNEIPNIKMEAKTELNNSPKPTSIPSTSRQILMTESASNTSNASSLTPQPSTSKATVQSIQPIMPVQKKKKKRASKEVRKARREEAALKALYAPKDSHVAMISPHVMDLMNKKSSISLTQPQNQQPHHVVKSECNRKTNVFNPNGSGLLRSIDFPQLSATFNQQTPCPIKTEQRSEAIKEEPVVTSPSKTEKPNKNKPSTNLSLVINLEDLLQKKQKSTQSTLPKQKRRVVKPDSKTRPVGNLLDSSGLTYIHRGKMRDKPKKKRHTRLKQSILTSRLYRSVKFAPESGKVNLLAELAPKSLSEVQILQMAVEDVQLDDKPSTTPPPAVTPELSQNSPVEKTMIKFNEEIPVNTEENIFKRLLEDALNLKSDSKPADVTPVKVEENVEIPAEVLKKVKGLLHSRKFRPYCDMYVSKALHGHVIELMKELHRFQDRLYHNDPMKYQTARRYVHGIKDVLAYLQLNKIQFVILAPDIEPNDVKGGLDEKIDSIVETAKENGIPYVFSGNRFILGKPIRIKNPVSVIGILNKQGAEEFVKKVLAEAEKLRSSYTNDFNAKVQEVSQSQ